MPGPTDDEGQTSAASVARRARAAALTFAPQQLAPGLSALRADADVAGALAYAWASWSAGTLGELDDEPLASLEKRAREAGAASLVLELGALRALAAEERGDVAAMVAAARRTSRMARAEALPFSECLANLVLARARRVSLRPHLALRILSALRRVAPPELEGFLAWESLLGGELQAGAAPPSGAAAGALWGSIDAARAGDRRAFEAQAAALERALADTAPARREGLELLAALDAERAPAEGARDWCEGRGASAPGSIHGLCHRAIDEDSESDDMGEAVMLASPDQAPRRVLGLAAAMVQVPGLVRLRKTRRRQGRVETLAAVLAAAGPAGVLEEDCFAQTYGFAYQPELHRGVFDVLLTRARAYLEGHAELVRADRRIALALRVPLLVPDPRCAAPLHDRLLRVLAAEGRASASDAAKHTGLSVRAVQEALRSLAEEGACAAEKQGRQLVYALEDTTFSEATELRALGSR